MQCILEDDMERIISIFLITAFYYTFGEKTTRFFLALVDMTVVMQSTLVVQYEIQTLLSSVSFEFGFMDINYVLERF
jgi:hypothetical protein